MNVSRFISSKTYSAFRQSLIRNIITISIVTTALSMTVMIVASSVFEGFQQQIAAKVFGFWGHIHITDVQSNRSIEAIPLQESGKIIDAIKSADYQSNGFNNNPVEAVHRFAVLPAISSHSNQYEGIFIKGVDKDFNWEFMHRFIKSGEVISFEDTVFSRDIILSQQIADKLNIECGEELVMHFFLDNKHIQRKLKLSGVYRTGLEEYDKKFAIADIRLIQQLMGWKPDQVTGLELFVKNLGQADLVNDFLYHEILPNSSYSETIRKKFPNIFEWLSLQDINKRFILGIILLVCIINMSTTILILIMSRTQMIGVLSSLGMTRWDQRNIFIRYGINILTRGILLGNLIGLSICLLQYKYKFIRLSEADYYLDHAPISLNPILIITVNVVFFIIVAINLLIPSWLVSKVDPVKALRFR
ncbi:MAG TPA: FtsX-like permease family protein [Saprospiraceae bacterium]|nr:FtsX-like permease family protein [Saprospiraceae bacterium]HNE61539.1 FtsX-like permease family protein [Saprospiraceae bacterium]HNF11797.1 FtsX-like permease family protein [Saprospiraceae bacterium]HNI80013.1 FtsX-like permease family protein [Saprospiraceae bacterium]HNN69108.1 FtsX-like permease family protein [Saprospiraceae bacterium]